MVHAGQLEDEEEHENPCPVPSDNLSVASDRFDKEDEGPFEGKWLTLSQDTIMLLIC